MATGSLGSRKWVIYTSDIPNEGGNQQYAVFLDESNAEATGFSDYSASSTAPRIPKGFQMRYANCQHPDNSAVRRRFWIGTPTKYGELIAGSSDVTTVDPLGSGTDTIDWIVTSLRGEKSGPLPYPQDTGLNDGDES